MFWYSNVPDTVPLSWRIAAALALPRGGFAWEDIWGWWPLASEHKTRWLTLGPSSVVDCFWSWKWRPALKESSSCFCYSVSSPVVSHGCDSAPKWTSPNDFPLQIRVLLPPLVSGSFDTVDSWSSRSANWGSVKIQTVTQKGLQLYNYDYCLERSKTVTVYLVKLYVK